LDYKFVIVFFDNPIFHHRVLHGLPIGLFRRNKANV
jgi:hypothetical protein